MYSEEINIRPNNHNNNIYNNISDINNINNYFSYINGNNNNKNNYNNQWRSENLRIWGRGHRKGQILYWGGMQ